MIFLIGARYRDRLAKPLERLGAEVCWLPDNPTLDSRLAGHADLQVFACHGQAVVGAGVCHELVNLLTNRGYVIQGIIQQGTVYPEDAGLCICDTGRYLLFNPKTAAAHAVGLSTSQGIAVHQGYTRCAVCTVTDQALITADHGIFQAFQGQLASGPILDNNYNNVYTESNQNIHYYNNQDIQYYNYNNKTDAADVLEITPGFIELDGFPYGFIGGASFKLDAYTVAFTGTLAGHPDKTRILSFLDKHHVKPVFLTQKPIFDVGGAVLLQ